MIFELLERIARLFSRNLCGSRITSKALRESNRRLYPALVALRSVMELSQSGLQKSNYVIVILFKS